MSCTYFDWMLSRSVDYSEMSKEDKGHVLADLLVKSAINQALETQKGVSNSFPKIVLKKFKHEHRINCS